MNRSKTTILADLPKVLVMLLNREAIQCVIEYSQSFFDWVKVVLDVFPKLVTCFGIGCKSRCTCVNILRCDFLEKEFKIIGDEFWGLNTPHCTENNFFAINRSCFAVLFLQSLIFRSVTISDGKTINGGSKTWVNDSLVLAACV